MPRPSTTPNIGTLDGTECLAIDHPSGTIAEHCTVQQIADLAGGGGSAADALGSLFILQGSPDSYGTPFDFGVPGKDYIVIGMASISTVSEIINWHTSTVYDGTPWEGRFGDIVQASADQLTWLEVDAPTQYSQILMGNSVSVAYSPDNTGISRWSSPREWINPSNGSWITLTNADGMGPYNADSLHTHSGSGINGIDWNAGAVAVSAAGNLTVSRHHICTGTSADYAITLPVLSGNTSKLVSVEMSAALTKQIMLSVGADAVTKSGTATGGTSVNAAGTGTVSTSGSSTTLTGSGTSFTTQLRVGDMILISSGTNIGVNRRVVAIGSNTSLTMDTAATVASGSFLYTSTGLAGASTAFSTDYTVGDGITIGGLTREVTYINGAGALAVDVPFLTAPSSSAHGKTTTKIDGKYYRLMWASEAALVSCDGSNWTKLAGKTIPFAASMKQTTPQALTADVWTKMQHQTTISDPAAMYSASGHYYTTPREGLYIASGDGTTNNASTTLMVTNRFVKNLSSPLGGAQAVVGSNGNLNFTIQATLSKGNLIEWQQYHYAVTSSTFGASYFNLCEVPKW